MSFAHGQSVIPEQTTNTFYEYFSNSWQRKPKKTAKVRIYPNPTSDWVKISSESPVKELALYNLAGKLVYKGQDLSLDLTSYKQGIYLVSIVFEDNTTLKRRIIKN